MSKFYNLVYAEDIGKDKPKYHKVGILMVKDDGKMSVKIDAVPTGNWNGWLNVYSQDKDKQSSQPQKQTDVEPF